MRRPNLPEFGKSTEFYGVGKLGIFPADREDHRRQRRAMSHAFSAAALQDQEEYVKGYVDILMQRMQNYAAEGKPVDVTRWYNYLTFDIIGELAFGEPFGCLKGSDYHPLVAMIFGGIRAQARYLFVNSFAVLRPLIMLMISKEDIRKRNETFAFSREKTERRLALGTDTRKDFITYILRNDKGGGMTHEETIVNARAFIVAGSETTATALSGFTFHITRTPEAYQRLVAEIRSSFASEGEINMRSTGALPYLYACLEETLRIFPPASETPPRISPGCEIAGKFIPQGVSPQ